MADRAVAEEMVSAVRRAFEDRGLTGRWEIFFPPGVSAFEVRGEGVRLIVEVGRALDRHGVARLWATTVGGAPVMARLRAWYLNEFVERSFDTPLDAVPVLISILEAHKPSGRGMPTAVSGAPERDDPDRPSLGADD